MLLALVAAAPAARVGNAPAPGGRAAAKKPKVDEAEAFFTKGPLPRLRIELGEADLAALRQQPRTYVKATIKEVGPNGEVVRVFEEVAVHLKGALGSFRGIDDRPALTVNFARHKKGRKFYGLEKLHLNNSVQDATYLSEDLGSFIFRSAGIPAARVSHARLWINDRDLGLYVLKESFDDGFLEHFFKNAKGPLYDGGLLADIDRDLPVMENKAAKNQQRINALVAAAREGDPLKRRERLDKLLDTERFLTFMALEAMTAHWDGYCFARNNYRVYDDPSSGKLVFLPHGMDQLFQQPEHGLLGTAGLVAQAVMSTPQARERYYQRLADLRRTVLDPRKLAARLEATAARVADFRGEIDPAHAAHQKQAAAEMLGRVSARIQAIDRRLASIPKPLKFDAEGVALLSGAAWELKSFAGEAAGSRFLQLGAPMLRIRCGASGCAASFRTTVVLPAGRYTFEGRCRAVAVQADASENSGVGLRISGGKRPGDASLTGTTSWQKGEFVFEVTDAAAEIVLVCELRASAGEATFDLSSLKLRRAK
jgi:hypothetical protein